ncbi:MAG: hypothetical protein ACQERB_13415 [Promethearchaeati archaeon]
MEAFGVFWDWFIGLGWITIILIILAIIFFALLFETLFLYIALKIVGAENSNFGSVFLTAFLMALVGWIPILGVILQWIFISSRHDTGFLKAIGIWLLAGLLPILIALSIIIFGLFPVFSIPLPF